MFVLAAQCAGCVFSGANAAYTPEEFAHQATDSSAAVILVHPQLLDVVLKATKEMGWDQKKQQSKIVLAVHKDEAGPAASGKCVGSRRFWSRLLTCSLNRLRSLQNT